MSASHGSHKRIFLPTKTEVVVLLCLELLLGGAAFFLSIDSASFQSTCGGGPDCLDLDSLLRSGVFARMVIVAAVPVIVFLGRRLLPRLWRALPSQSF